MEVHLVHSSRIHLHLERCCLPCTLPHPLSSRAWRSLYRLSCAHFLYLVEPAARCPPRRPPRKLFLTLTLVLRCLASHPISVTPCCRAGGHRAAHIRAKEFVEATAVKYGFSSKVLAELGGGEKQRVLEFAAGFVCVVLLPQDPCDACPYFHAVISSGAKKDVWYVCVCCHGPVVHQTCTRLHTLAPFRSWSLPPTASALWWAVSPYLNSALPLAPHTRLQLDRTFSRCCPQCCRKLCRLDPIRSKQFLPLS